MIHRLPSVALVLLQRLPCRLDFNDPPTAVGGICVVGLLGRLDFNDPPTAVGGIGAVVTAAL